MKDDQDIKNIDAVDDTFRCHAAKQKLIPVVFDKKQNKLIDVDALFTTTKKKAVSIRDESLRSYHDGEPRYLCCFCHEAVYFRFKGKQNTGAHAVHRKHSGNCVDTRFEKSRDKINTAKYPTNESYEHIKTKGYLFESLRQDSRFKNLRIEKRLEDKNKKKYKNGVTVHRQPDILAEFNGVKNSC